MNNLAGLGSIAHWSAAMLHALNCVLTGRLSVELELLCGHSKKPFLNGVSHTLDHLGNMHSVHHCHRNQTLQNHAFLGWPCWDLVRQKFHHQATVKNSSLGGKMVLFDYSLSSWVFTAVDKRAPAGRWTWDASKPNFSGLDDKLAHKYQPMMKPNGSPVRIRIGLIDS